MQVTIGIYINQTVGSAFFKVFHHTELRRRYEGTFEFPETASDDDILEQTYRIFNIDPPVGYTGASLSVADVVTINSERSYEVATFGFNQLEFTVTGDPYIVSLPEPTINEIRIWRRIAHNNNHPSGIEDYFSQLNMCRRCRGKGHMTGYAPKSCNPCNGTGEYPATDDERIMTGLRNMVQPLKSKSKEQPRHAT